MKPTHAIAMRIYQAGVRLPQSYDLGALSAAPEWMRKDLCNIWLDSMGHDAEILVSAAEVKALGAQQAWYHAVFDDMQRSDLSESVDATLRAIQGMDIEERRQQERAA